MNTFFEWFGRHRKTIGYVIGGVNLGAGIAAIAGHHSFVRVGPAWARAGRGSTAGNSSLDDGLFFDTRESKSALVQRLWCPVFCGWNDGERICFARLDSGSRMKRRHALMGTQGAAIHQHALNARHRLLGFAQARS